MKHTARLVSGQMSVVHVHDENVLCVRETEMLVEEQPPKRIFICDLASLVINKFSLYAPLTIRRGP